MINKEDFTENKSEVIDRKGNLNFRWSDLESFINTIYSRFFMIKDIDGAIDSSLKDLGVLTEASRTYIFSFSNDYQYISNTYEWHREELSPRIHKFQNLKSTKFPWLIEQLKVGHLINVSNSNSLDDGALTFKDFLELQDINSSLISPLYLKAKLYGFIGIDSVHKVKEWSERDLYILKMISIIISNSLEYNRSIESQKISDTYHNFILENINDIVIILDSELIIEKTNQNVIYKILKYKIEDLEGDSISNLIYQNDKEMFMNILHSINNNNNSKTFQLRLIDKEGILVWFECKIELLGNQNDFHKYFIVCNEITQRKLLEGRYKNLFEKSPNSIFLVDFEGKIVDCNLTTKRVFGYDKDFFLGKTINQLYDHLHLDIRQYFKQVFQSNFYNDYPHPIEVKVGNKEDSLIWVEIQASIIKQSDNMLIQLIFQDITEKKKVELYETKFKEELEKKVKVRTEELNTTMQQQKLYLDQIVKSSKFKTEFMATMSHELRTPLNAIIGFTDLLLEEVYGTFTNEQKDFLLDIKASAEHQFDMINHILDISKIESGQITLNIQKFSLNSLVEQIKSSFKPSYLKKNIKLKVRGLENEIFIYADPIRLKEILDNLLNNSLKFTISGYVKLEIKERYNDWIFKVSDTGIGIAREDFHLIFKDFMRVGSPYVRSIPGTGLGLSLVKRLIELHEGEISFNSLLGAGTSFTFNIPKRLEKKANNNLNPN